ncbi:MAG: hypothetical protein ACRETA_05570 [Gammaproteobacteria bacterium]
MNRDQIQALFKAEFASLALRFAVYDLPLGMADSATEDYISMPGVYVFWHSKRGVIKVGRSLTNSRKRALEHILANTGGSMSALKGDVEARLLLFNLRNTEDSYWAAALEIFFEDKLKPEIRSRRTG